MLVDHQRFRSLALTDGWEILVGKTARDNDWLSLKEARPNDFWFHVAGVSGSHVIARHPDSPDRLTRDVKRIAAGLAAYYSKARAGGNVCVHWTQCRHVRKRRGAPDGQVILKKSDKFQIRPLDPKTLREQSNGNE